MGTTLYEVDVYILTKDAMSGLTRALNDGGFRHVPFHTKGYEGGTIIVCLIIDEQSLKLLSELSMLSQSVTVDLAIDTCSYPCLVGLTELAKRNIGWKCGLIVNVADVIRFNDEVVAPAFAGAVV